METQEELQLEVHEHQTPENTPLPHDSMVTVRLSEPPSTTATTSKSHEEKVMVKDEDISEDEEEEAISETDAHRVSAQSSAEAQSLHIRTSDLSGVSVVSAEEESTATDLKLEEHTSESPKSPVEERRGSDGSVDSEDGQVNWEELEKTEELQPRDQDSEDSTALLLARLEQENNLLVTNPKSGLTPVQATQQERRRSQSRPPSMQQLKKMVHAPTPSALRYSLIPAPPMTDLEFYAALVQDYKRTAQRLPTLLSKKIRSGVPPPLRGVVWQSMSGARDRLLEEEFDRLCGESSPYEGIISKDLGRSFPGVEMFRDPEGDGQQMLGRVLKCFSLYDSKIGYCQGLGFLVGPLLMHMGDKQAFCVLVRLMEHYDLRNCFLPDLSGLHVRIYQFRELLRKHLPKLNAHLDELQIEPAYVSQWFLSFFAVTCPLPMLFRIYDVIFAEGASETIMRVALAVMRKNEEKILACTEFEDVMQLLLSRGLWDCYHYNADEFVEDFVSLTSIVTNDGLRALEISHKESKESDSTTSPASETVGSAAARFLGRLWTVSNVIPKAATLSPPAGQTRPASFLRRSPSKQSIASTLNSIEGGTDSIMSTASTDATTLSRDSSNTDASSTRAESNTFTTNGTKTATNNQDHGLHGQIEDLLTALSELQRDHAILATQLQREREEREEDHHAVRSLLNGLRKKSTSESDSEGSFDTITPDTDVASDEEYPTPIAEMQDPLTSVEPSPVSQEKLSLLLDNVELRVSKKTKGHSRRSSMLTTKAQLRDDLARSKESLIIEVSKSQELSRKLTDMEQELANARDELKESHTHFRNAHADKQRLEKQVHDLRAEKKRTPVSTPDGSAMDNEWARRASVVSLNTSLNTGGLRELKLGRSNSKRSVKGEGGFAKRSSSLNTAAIAAKENIPPPADVLTAPVDSQSPSSNPASGTTTPYSPIADTDALILELVQAKTAEAVAKQEAEEARGKLESLRKLLSGGSASPSIDHHFSLTSSATSNNAGVSGHRPSPSQPNLSFMPTDLSALPGASYFSGFGTGITASIGRAVQSTSPGATAASTAAAAPTTPGTVGAAAAAGSFWGGWGKRTVSAATIPEAK